MAKPAKAQESMLNGDFGDFFDSARQDEVTETVIESVTGVEWVPVKEAAHILDLSERSIWRRIKKGKLEKKEEDGRTYVAIDRPEIIQPDTDYSHDRVDTSVGNRQSQQRSVTDTESHLIELVSELTDKVSEMSDKLVQASGRACFMEATNVELRRELEAKSEAVRLLEDKQTKSVEESKQLKDVQHHYSILEEEKNTIESKYQEAQKRIDHYKQLLKRSVWKKFSDWMMGR